MAARGTTISMYFGEKHTDTLKRLDSLADEYRLSRTQVIEFLLRHYEKTTPISQSFAIK